MPRCKVDELARGVSMEISRYARATAEDVKSASKQTALRCARQIKSKSPKETGKYKKGWTSKKTGESATSISIMVYNRLAPQLTHLLEKGHAVRLPDGRLTGAMVPGYPHIKPAEEWAQEALPKEIERLIRE